MRVLIACEYSGRVREAFRFLGHDAMSCDLLPSEVVGNHYQGDINNVLDGFMPVMFASECDPEGNGWCQVRDIDPSECNCIGCTQYGIEYIERDGQLFGRPIDSPNWDLMIAHPPCTYLAVSGLHWNKRVPGRAEETEKALDFVQILMNAPIEKIAIENPVSCISSRIRKPDQIIQPWQFGHGETKKTCLWLKNLPVLQPENIVSGRFARVHRMPPSPDRWKERSRTYPGIALAMANQWGYE